MPINIKIQEVTKLYETTKSEGAMYDKETEPKNWIHPAKHIAVIEGHEDSTHFIQAYTDGSKNKEGVGSGIVVFAGNSLKTTLKYKLNERCSNNQTEQIAILKALEYIQGLREKKQNSDNLHRQQNHLAFAIKPKTTYPPNRSN